MPRQSGIQKPCKPETLGGNHTGCCRRSAQKEMSTCKSKSIPDQEGSMDDSLTVARVCHKAARRSSWPRLINQDQHDYITEISLTVARVCHRTARRSSWPPRANALHLMSPRAESRTSRSACIKCVHSCGQQRGMNHNFASKSLYVLLLVLQCQDGVSACIFFLHCFDSSLAKTHRFQAVLKRAMKKGR